MKQFGMHEAVYLSFFSKPLYRDVARNWRGVGFLYLLMLLLVCWLVTFIDVQAGISEFVDDVGPPILEQVPTVSIRGGRVSIDRPVPHTIADPETGKPIAIIDTSGQITSLEGSDAVMLLTESEIVVSKNPGRYETHKLSQFPDMTITRGGIAKVLRLMKTWAVLLLFPFALLFSFIWRVVQALIYGAIGQAFNAMVGGGLEYQQTVRLAVIAVTPVLVSFTLLDLCDVAVPWSGMVGFLMAMAYLFVAVKTAAEGGGAVAEPGYPQRTRESDEGG